MCYLLERASVSRSCTAWAVGRSKGTFFACCPVLGEAWRSLAQLPDHGVMTGYDRCHTKKKHQMKRGAVESAKSEP